ncbi:MAG: peptidase T [Lachnospiraceae bacterium]|nr:peptidase T [Lachnospiraceae bacterium]MDY4968801.1 peptidase T [Lachnospiraceae bacterium]
MSTSVNGSDSRNALLKRFFKYVTIDTQSDEDSTACPSTSKQFQLADLLYQELQDMGICDIVYDRECCYLYASIPSNLPEEQAEKVPAIGFIAHMDTSPEITGADVKPRLVENYDGGAILLNEEKGIVLSPADYPELSACAGRTLIVTDGTTLLGADDKAGVAEIMTAVEEMLAHPEVPHGVIKLAFTPDEEVGRGMDHFNVEAFGAQYAYTVDGGSEGELEFENFNAASAKVYVTGKSIHPGDAKNRMINASLMAGMFMQQLPPEQTPEHTEGYEGFYHLCSMQGDIEHAQLNYIIRDHDRELFEQKKVYFQQVCDFLNQKYGADIFLAEIKDSYYNMKEQIIPAWHLIETAEQAMKDIGIEPKVVPIRGGTDGSRLSFMGVPCPNLYTGGHNYHGRFEYACVESMESMVKVIRRIAAVYTEKCAEQ